jgi:hypothetical protein
MSEVLEVEFEGKTYPVRYSVEERTITVRTAFDSKSTQIGGSSPEVLARILGEELLSEAKEKGLL